MIESYFVIHNSEGDTTVEQLSLEELKHRLTKEDGCNYYSATQCLSSIPERDTNYWREGDILIIKGDFHVEVL